MFSITDIINKEVKKKEQRKRTSWYATDLGKCLTGAYHARLGREPMERNDRKYRLFAVGNLFEKWVIDTLNASDSDATFKQPETLTIEGQDLHVRPDLIVTLDNGDQILYELKTCHSGKFGWMIKKGEGPDRHYEMQTWCGLKATGIDTGRLLYMSKDDMRIEEFTVYLDDTQLEADVMRDLEILNTAWKTKTAPEPPPVWVIQNGKKKLNWKADWCEYHHHCMGDDNWRENAK